MAGHLRNNPELWLIRTGANVFTAFGAVAVLLALIGVYGVKAYIVSRRTREIGIRVALGARSADVLWLMLRDGLAVTAIGLGIGLVLAWGMGQLLRGMLYQISPQDPLTFLLAVIALAAAALLAAYLPARKATRIAPTTALRHE